MNSSLSFRKYLYFFLLIFSTTPLLISQKSREVQGVYRSPVGIREGFEIWIVDGPTIRREIYPEFLYGGNSQRYTFIPQREIWVDNAIGVEEFDYTVAHELRERALMARKGLSYSDAHDSALAVELGLRMGAEDSAAHHELAIAPVSPTNAEGEKEFPDLPDSITLRNVYRLLLRRIDSVSVWVVDGSIVRRDIYPDFGFSGCDAAYHFIPAGEIWIDNQSACEEMAYSIECELREREFMKKGSTYDVAYEKAIAEVKKIRQTVHTTALKKGSIKVLPPLDRAVGTGDEHK